MKSLSYLILCLSLLLINSFANAKESSSSQVNIIQSKGVLGVPQSSLGAQTGSLVILDYTLYIDSRGGPIRETTLESMARKNGIYSNGTIYEPFHVTLGKNQVIFGFEKGLAGMKKGQKKWIRVIPSEGYGRPIIVERERIAPDFTIIRSKEMFKDTLKKVVKKSQLSPENQVKILSAKVGDIIFGDNDTPAKIIAITPKTISLEMENAINPYYKKRIEIGTITETEEVDYKIIAVNTDTITISIINKKSPFYKKRFAIGESISLEDGEKYTIQNITDTTVTLLADHEFMKKILYFEVNILDIVE